MEIVVLCGVPGSGKSTLSRTMFSDYVRINLDTLRTRHREDVAISQAISRQRSMVIDNTNVTSRVRRKYIEIARKHGFRVRAVCLVCPPSLAISRNSKRKGTKEYVPVSAIMRYYRIFEIPTKEEGFDSVEFVLQMPEEMQANAKWNGVAIPPRKFSSTFQKEDLFVEAHRAKFFPKTCVFAFRLRTPLRNQGLPPQYEPKCQLPRPRCSE